MKMPYRTSHAATGGFTLIEMLVSVAIFTVVMVIAMGALLSMSESDRKVQTVKSVIDNLNFSLDSITRAVRTGSGYGCNAPRSSGGGDCPSGGYAFFFTDSNGRSVGYWFQSSSANAAQCGQSGTVGCILRTTDGGVTWAPITDPQVVITKMSFFLIGSGTSDNTQSKLTILMSGYVQFKGGGDASACHGLTSSGASTCFALETSVTQRIFDQ